ncbi:hypothetical protein FGO68_gene9053 [Halteria grandinella]|uniref:RING-type domain-containing protein n=1 Tax=Halteria grandinella TaxID=5974 RepID=A0A8J8NRD0_HALGN|nr:hypothetical protein FGO68_gene9053 [Halteria grandinella]
MYIYPVATQQPFDPVQLAHNYYSSCVSERELISVKRYPWFLQESEINDECSICLSFLSQDPFSLHCQACNHTFCQRCYQYLDTSLSRSKPPQSLYSLIQASLAQATRSRDEDLIKIEANKRYQELAQKQSKVLENRKVEVIELDDEGEIEIDDGCLEIEDDTTQESSCRSIMSSGEGGEVVEAQPIESYMGQGMSMQVINGLTNLSQCLNPSCHLSQIYSKDPLVQELNIHPEDLIFVRNLQQKEAYKLLNDQPGEELSLNSQEATPLGQSFLCNQCQLICPRTQLVDHYKRDCLDAAGINCVANPYCKVKGTRRDILEHQDICPNVKVHCERCESMVVRKLMGQSHNCFDNALKRLERIERTTVYGYKRLKTQTEARIKFENVIINVRKKLGSLNKRLEELMFNGDIQSLSQVHELVKMKTIPFQQRKPSEKCKNCRSTGRAIYNCEEGEECKSGSGQLCDSYHCKRMCFQCCHLGRVYCRQCIQFCKDCWLWYCRDCQCGCFLSTNQPQLMANLKSSQLQPEEQNFSENDYL